MGKKVLIVDDSSSMRQLLRMSLSGAGYEVLEGVDGSDALGKLDGQPVSLIVSDVNMPNMNGIEFLKALRGKQQYRFTPVLMLTTENEESLMSQGKAAGAKAWMIKPFKPEKFLSAVEKLAV
ncbi:MAG: response regulator [Ketobacteraceae bacterium]|nr:response regulator [Ketobacteraceae bacterium]